MSSSLEDEVTACSIWRESVVCVMCPVNIVQLLLLPSILPLLLLPRLLLRGVLYGCRRLFPTCCMHIATYLVVRVAAG